MQVGRFADVMDVRWHYDKCMLLMQEGGLDQRRWTTVHSVRRTIHRGIQEGPLDPLKAEWPEIHQGL